MFQTVEDYENDPNASKAELALIAACRMGTGLTVNGGVLPEEGNSNPDIVVRANLIRLLARQATSGHERGLQLEGVVIAGTLDLRFAKCWGSLVMQSCRFAEKPLMSMTELPELSLLGSHFPGLDLQGASVKGNVSLRAVKSTGLVNLSVAQIGGQVDCDGARLIGGLSAQSANLKGPVFLSNIASKGTVDLNAAQIGGQLVWVGVTLDGNGGMAVNAQSLRVEAEFAFRAVKSVVGRVDLTSAQVRDLVDDESSWEKSRDLILDGFTYDKIGGSDASRTFAERKGWLQIGSHVEGKFLPQPYTQFAKVMRNAGHTAEARKALMERDTILFQEAETADREALLAAYQYGVPAKSDSGKIWLRLQARRLWSGLSRRVIGHGHRPEYALFWALGAVAFGTGWFFLAYAAGVMVPNSDVILTSADWLKAMNPAAIAPTPAWSALPSAKHYETFYALPYALDVFVPFVSLGQEQAWAASTVTWFGWATRCMTFAYQIAGWVVTSLGIAAITGFVQRNAPD